MLLATLGNGVVQTPPANLRTRVSKDCAPRVIDGVLGHHVQD